MLRIRATTTRSLFTAVNTFTMSKRKRSAATALAAQIVEQNVIADIPILPPSQEAVGQGRPRKMRKPTVVEQEEDMTGAADVDAPPKKVRRSRKKTVVTEDGPSALVEAEVDNGANEAPNKKSKRARKKAVVDDEDDFSPEKEKKARTKWEPKPELVYIIPDVERRETTFKGRLGYACLNMILRNKRPAKDAIFCSRTCRIDSIKKNGMDWVKDLGRKNVEDLLKIIKWNEENNIKFMRISSELFPFASHVKYGYSLDYCSSLMAKVGEFTKKHGHRLTTHPGQFTQLGSPKPDVVDAAVRELKYHCEMLDMIGTGPDGVMIVHGGGVYEDKAATIERIKKTITERLAANVRARLVLENDELCYSAEELLPLCEELDVPLVFDYHHDTLNPSSIPPSEIISRANNIFRRRGIRPKQHLSEPRPGAETLMEKRAHADRCQTLPLDLPDDMDLMIEAKDKEQAVLHLHRIYNLHPVIHANLRPPAENQSKETKGRKSNKRAKATAGDIGDIFDDDEPLTELEDDELSAAIIAAPDPDSLIDVAQNDMGSQLQRRQPVRIEPARKTRAKRESSQQR